VIKLVLLTTDAREHHREYHKTEPYFGTAPASLLEGFKLLSDEVEVHVVACSQRPMSSPEKLAPNVWFHLLQAPRIGWMRTGYQGCIRAVRRKLKQLRPDIVHGQGTERDCAISAVFSGFPNILTIHGNMRRIAKVNRARPFTFLWLAARLESFVLPRSKGVVCISRYTQDEVRPLARKTWIVPNAVDKQLFEVRPMRPKVPTILCIGHVSALKNQVEFIRALDSLAANRSFRVLFLGVAPPHDPYCTEFLNLIETRPWCTYEGVVEHSRLTDYFARASFLALPSLEDNCPMVVLEAMASSVPVIAARVGGVPELVENRISGLLMDPASRESMQSAATEMLDDPENACRMALSARKRALEQYHPKIVAQKHLEIYREVCAAAL
jgi:glycosyltransferase involved in cell wall biosynthesis